jgi:predicted nucleic acid-binding protein
MGKRFLIDTNVLIYFLNGNAPSDDELLSTLLENDFAISTITLVELLSWKLLSKNDVNQVIKNLEGVKIISVNTDTSIKAAELRRIFQIKLPDAIIAATCLMEGLTLLTNDLSDFKQIPDFPIIHPYKSS